jgi:hypothetical protein
LKLAAPVAELNPLDDLGQAVLAVELSYAGIWVMA